MYARSHDSDALVCGPARCLAAGRCPSVSQRFARRDPLAPVKPDGALGYRGMSGQPSIVLYVMKGAGVMMDKNADQALAGALARNWWIPLVSGVVAIIFGILALILPHITLFTLIVLFGIFALIQGIASLARASTAGQQGRSWIWPVVGGLMCIAAAIAAFVWPGITALVLLYIIGAWAIILGISEVVAAIGLREETGRMWLQIAAGVISVLFGILLFVHPGAGALALVWLIGIYAILLGVTRIALAFELRREPEQWLNARNPGMPPTPAY